MINLTCRYFYLDKHLKQWWQMINLTKVICFLDLCLKCVCGDTLTSSMGYRVMPGVILSYINIKQHLVWGIGSCQESYYHTLTSNKGNAKRSVSPCLKIRPCDLDLWPWKSIGFQILLRSKYVPSLVKIHWRMLILECLQGCYAVKIWPGDIDLWPMILKINRFPDSPKD
jgi:hypothetical protein